MLAKVSNWYRTKLGLFVFGVVELAIAYGFASLAIDRGNPIWYLLAIVFLYGALKNLLKLIGKVFNGKTSSSRRD